MYGSQDFPNRPTKVYPFWTVVPSFWRRSEGRYQGKPESNATCMAGV